ncbi:DUF4139 domain-containing protein [Jiulongibacter sp. NS-SX5]|uniref:DUF4139 domain-containing protein n=1 Tax=Jiulongibacter sp. NS-SX5 TaxID=3463854 RepID=UPI004059B461
MKQALIILFFSLCLCIQPLKASEPVKAKMEEVTVYTNQAFIKSTAVFEYTAGKSIIEITELPSTIDPNSISIGGRGDFVLLSVKFEKDFMSKRQLSLQKELDQLEDDIEILEMKLEVNKEQQKMLLDNTEIKAEDEKLSLTELENASVFFKKKLILLGEEKLLLKKELDVLKDEKKNLEEQMKNDPSRNLPLGKALLTIEANKSGKANLDLSYMAYNTGWSPFYDIRVENTNSPMVVLYKAEVRQNTGVDWDNVKVRLSTAQVNRRTVKPELSPKYLYFYENRPPVPMRQSYAKNELEAAPVAEMDMESSADYVSLETGTLNQQFVISKPYTIKSGSEEMVEIKKESIEAEYLTYAVPKFDSNGFLVAEVKDWETYGFLPASGNVYFEGAYVGKTYIGKTGVEEVLKVSLGRDERVEVSKKEIKDFKQRRTFGSNIRESFGYEFILKNNKSESISLRVEDQLPVSQDSAIEVEVEELSSGKLDKETGKITWDINVSEKSAKNLILKYEVKYPKDKKVGNL